MKLNLCCGYNHLKDYINVDKEISANPNLICNLEVFPWPWEDNSIDEIRLNHALEHLGEITETYKKIMQELYRICKKDALIHITVPWFRHYNFWADPTHVRVITPFGLSLLSKKNNLEWIKGKAANSPLGIYWDVDFEIVYVEYRPDINEWKKVFPYLGMTQEFISKNIEKNDLISEVYVIVKALGRRAFT